MALYNIANKELHALEKRHLLWKDYRNVMIYRKQSKKNIDIIAPDCLVISEEFSDWEDSRL